MLRRAPVCLCQEAKGNNERFVLCVVGARPVVVWRGVIDVMNVSWRNVMFSKKN